MPFRHHDAEMILMGGKEVKVIPYRQQIAVQEMKVILILLFVQLRFTYGNIGDIYQDIGIPPAKFPQALR